MTRRPFFSASPRDRGFTFVEILFAIAVLSIGLFGIAAALYVGVDQTRTSLDDSTAATVARQAAAVMGQVMTTYNAIGLNTGFNAVTVESGAADLFNVVQASQIVSDGQYAWIPLYRPHADAPRADLIIIVVRSAARSRFDKDDFKPDAANPGDYPANLTPAKCDVTVTGTQLTVAGVPSGVERLTPGAIIVLSGVNPLVNGRILKLGVLESDGTWTLEPGYDLSDTPGTFTTTNAFVVGRGYADPTKHRNGYVGANQAVSAYATIVQLRQVP